VKLSNDKKILLCCSLEALPEILKQAQQVGLLTDEHELIITSLDAHTIDLQQYGFSGTSIVGMRLVEPNSELVKNVTDEWKIEDYTTEMLKVEAAMTYDAVLLFAKMLSNLNGIQSISQDCNDPTATSFGNGTSIINYMKTTEPFKGLTGDVHFDEKGNRKFKLELYSVDSEGTKAFGSWSSSEGIEITEHKQSQLEQDETFIVLTVIVS